MAGYQGRPFQHPQQKLNQDHQRSRPEATSGLGMSCRMESCEEERERPMEDQEESR
ncbi:MAG: hypothetical protein GY696_00565 [Gammaproteobacteria bacterium]|nr:hypothetical protein [Gammaproteobacteria bacterium]